MTIDQDGRKTERLRAGLLRTLMFGIALVAWGAPLHRAEADPPPPKEVKFCLRTAPPGKTGVGMIGLSWVLTPTNPVAIAPGGCLAIPHGAASYVEVYDVNQAYGFSTYRYVKMYPACCESATFDCNAEKCWKI